MRAAAEIGRPTVNPQVPGSSPGRGARNIVTNQASRPTGPEAFFLPVGKLLESLPISSTGQKRKTPSSRSQRGRTSGEPDRGDNRSRGRCDSVEIGLQGVSSCRARCRLESKSFNVCSTSAEICADGRGISTETVGTGGRDAGVMLGLLVAQPLISSTEAITKGQHLAAFLVVGMLCFLGSSDEAGDLPQGFAQALGFLLGVVGPGLGMAALLGLQALGLGAGRGNRSRTDQRPDPARYDPEDGGQRLHACPMHWRYSPCRRMVRPRSVMPACLSQRSSSAQAPG